MSRCSNCGSEIPEGEFRCPRCGELDPSSEAEFKELIEEYSDKRKRMLAIFVLGMFVIMFMPFFRLLLAVICFLIALPMSVFYTWKKRKAEEKLEERYF